MGEEFQGGVCGGTWWNSNLFSGGGGGGGGFSSPCSVAQFGGGYDMGSFGWSHGIIRSMSSNNFFDDNSLVFTADFDSTLDTLGFGVSPTSSTNVWNQNNQFSKSGSNEENFDSILQDNLSSSLNYELGENLSTMIFSCNFPSQEGSPPSNTSGDSSTITSEGGLTTSFPLTSSASYLIQTLFNNDVDDDTQLINTNDYGSELMATPCSWDKSSINDTPFIRPPVTPLLLSELPPNEQFNRGVNMLVNNDRQFSNDRFDTTGALSNIRTSLLNSLQSGYGAPSSNRKSHKLSTQTRKLKHEVVHESKRNINNNEQPTSKRPRIETPSPLPTFKVRKEKLGDRITALQQLVSPFGKTDTASVLHEAIEYIKFLHDQVHVLSTPYLKNGAVVQHQQVSAKLNSEKETKPDLRSRGLCVVPVSSTYPVTQETPVDFWTPTFGGTTFK